MSMSSRLVTEIAQRMREKPTEELLAIWNKHDTDEWSFEAFEAIKIVLKERSHTVPELRGDELPTRKPKAASLDPEIAGFVSTVLSSTNMGAKWGIAFFVIGLLYSMNKGVGTFEYIFSKDGFFNFALGFVLGGGVEFFIGKDQK